MESFSSTVNLYILQRNSITSIGIFGEVPLLLSQSTDCNATKKQTQTILLEMRFENFGKLLGKAL